MRHEFLHALVEQQAGPHAPLWLREGLVEVWSGPNAAANPPRANQYTPAPSLSPDAVESALAHASTEVASEAAHRAAAWYATQMLARYGRAQVLTWLRSGLPAGVAASLGQR
jgi:stage II sporulation protein D